MNYFKNIKTLEEAKKLYRELAKLNHPDKGGSIEAMQKINFEYDLICSQILKGENLNETDFNNAFAESQKVKEILNKIGNLPLITIEILGSWIWVTGLTMPVKNELKAAGLFWASKKCAWFYKSPEEKSKSRGKTSLDQIRSTYGSINVTSNNFNTKTLR